MPDADHDNTQPEQQASGRRWIRLMFPREATVEEIVAEVYRVHEQAQQEQAAKDQEK